MFEIIFQTMRMPRYGLTGLAVALLLSAGLLSAPQWGTVQTIFAQEVYTFGTKLSSSAAIIWWAAVQQYTWPHMIAVGVITLLTAVVVGLVLRDAHLRLHVGRTSGAGLVGAFVGILGVGCSACGAALLTSIIGAAGAAWIVRVLPFHGAELSFLGICVLFGTIWVLARKLARGAVCTIKTPQSK